MKRLHKLRARLERAKVHKTAFGKVWNAFLDTGQPYDSSVTMYENGEGVIGIYLNEEMPDDLLSIEFGEMLYQLRAALDSLVYELAIIDSGQDPPPDAEQLEFPIRESSVSFENAARKIAPLTDEHKSMIASIQPYDIEYRDEGAQRVARALKMLNDWARKDRHRGLRVIASWASNKDPHIETMPPGCELEWLEVTPDGPIPHNLSDDHIVARFKISGWQPGLELEANPNLAIDVSLDDAEPPQEDSDTLNNRALEMLAVVAVIIDGFEKTLD